MAFILFKPPEMPPESRLPWPFTALLAGSAYFAASCLWYPQILLGDHPTLAFPAAGVAMAAVLMGGWAAAAGIFPAALIYYLAFASRMPLESAASLAAANTSSAVLGWLLMKHVGGFNPAMRRQRDVFWFFLVGVFGEAALNASVGTIVLKQLPFAEAQDAYRAGVRGMMSIGCGIIMVAPAVLAWGRLGLPRVPAAGEVVERGVVLAGTTLSALIAFPDILEIGRLNMPVALLPFPFLLWAALRHNSRSVSLNILICGLIAVFGTSRADGALSYSSPFQTHATLFAYFIVYVCMALTVMVLMEERRAVETLLRESENRLELAIRGASLGTWDWNLVTGQITINEEWANMLGYSIDEIKPTATSRIPMLHPDDLGPTARSFQQHFIGRTPFFENEHRMRTKDGHWKWILDRGMIVERDASGKPLRASGVHQDIDARKRAEQALRNSEERLLKIINSTPNVAIQGYDKEGRILFWNRASERLFGWKEEEVLGRPPQGLLLEDDEAQRFVDMIAQIDRTGEPVENTEWVYTARDGRKGTLYSSVFAIPAPDGGNQFVCMDVDITERNRAENELRESQRLYSTLVGNLPGMTYRCRNDRNWTMEFVSRGSIALTGYDPEELTGNKVISYGEIIHPEDRDRIWNEVQEAVAKGAGYQLGYRIRDRRGVEKWVWEQGCGVSDPAGGEVFLEGFITDDTPRRTADMERQNLETQLMHTQKLESLGVMAGGIAHHFNNLLLGIQGNSELAIVQSQSNPAVRNYVEKILQSSQRAAELCGQMLAYSGKGRFQMAPVQLSHLIQEMEHLIRVGVSRNCAIEYKLAEKLPPIQADPAQMRQVILNLVTNASDALADKQGIVTVRTGFGDFERPQLTGPAADEPPPPGRYVFIEVTDNGCGMDPETLARIFDPFFTTKFVGRGLGLAAVLGIIRAHRGAVYVMSAQGRGSTFRILFPPIAAPPLMARASQIWRTWRTEGRILIIDDEEMIRDMGRGMVRQFGFEVLTASSGSEGIATLEREKGRIDLVVLDLTMPGMSGIETLAGLVRVKPDVRVLISSGSNADEKPVPEGGGSVVVGYLPKPYGPQDLFEKLRNLFPDGGSPPPS